MSNHLDALQLKKLIIETCYLLGIEIQPKQSYFELWQMVCKELSIATLNKLLVIIDTGTNITPLQSAKREIILKELQKRGQSNE